MRSRTSSVIVFSLPFSLSLKSLDLQKIRFMQNLGRLVLLLMTRSLLGTKEA